MANDYITIMDIASILLIAKSEKLKQLRFDIWTFKRMQEAALAEVPPRYLYAKYCEIEKDKLKKIYKTLKGDNNEIG